MSLILTRKKDGPGIIIGENTVVRIVKVNGNTVRLSVDAPIDVGVRREELLEAMKEFKKGPRQRTPPATKASGEMERGFKT